MLPRRTLIVHTTVVATYPPRRCRIGTFTMRLTAATTGESEIRHLSGDTGSTVGTEHRDRFARVGPGADPAPATERVFVDV